MERSLPPAPFACLSICPSVLSSHPYARTCTALQRICGRTSPFSALPFRCKTHVMYHPGAYNMYMLLYYILPALTQGDSSGLTCSPICLIRGSWSQQDEKKKRTFGRGLRPNATLHGPRSVEGKTKSGSPKLLHLLLISFHE